MYNDSVMGGWENYLQDEFKKEYYASLYNQVNEGYKTNSLFPPQQLLYNALKMCPLEDTKVVIIGQDPYPQLGYANGLCFSCTTAMPKSLNNILRELKSEYSSELAKKPLNQNQLGVFNGDLSYWARQGVLLLNSILTVKKGKPLSCETWGWQALTVAIIRQVLIHNKNTVFLVWGKKADEIYNSAIDINLFNYQQILQDHKKLYAAHPVTAWNNKMSITYNKFEGCNHFVLANQYLIEHGITPIDWI